MPFVSEHGTLPRRGLAQRYWGLTWHIYANHRDCCWRRSPPSDQRPGVLKIVVGPADNNIFWAICPRSRCRRGDVISLCLSGGLEAPWRSKNVSRRLVTRPPVESALSLLRIRGLFKEATFTRPSCISASILNVPASDWMGFEPRDADVWEKCRPHAVTSFCLKFTRHGSEVKIIAN